MREVLEYFIILLLTVTAVLPNATALAQETHSAERGLTSVWRQHVGNPDDHTRIVHLCALFKSRNPDDHLLAVGESLAAWHLLKLGQTNAAVKAFEVIAADEEKGDHLRAAARNMARAWLTRIDREKTKRVLRKIYLEEVEYPASLDDLTNLPEGERPPLTDRWGKRWSYELVGFKYIRAAKAQRYKLHSTSLGDSSDLARALAASYASGIDLVPTKLITSPRPAVEFGARPLDDGLRGPSDLRRRRSQKQATVRVRGKTRITLGQEIDGIRLAYIGRTSIILANRDHWLILPKPPRKK